MAIVVKIEASIRWFPVDIYDEICAVFWYFNFIPRKGRVLSVAVSMVKVKEGPENRKIGDLLKLREEKPKIGSEQYVVYYFKCGLCDMDYLHRRVAEHSSQNSSIGKHMLNTHGISKSELINKFSVLKKCRSKFDCLINEMLIIQDLKPTLNVQTDSIRAKLFT